MKNYSFLWKRTQAGKWAKAFCLCFFLVGTSTYALAVPEANTVQAVQQNRAVKGTVVDETGEPIIGANVKVVGTTVGSITDLDGQFNLSVPTNGKIEISFIGYATQVVTVPANGVVKVIMAEDSKLLEEVVIVGYGAQRVKDLTGAASVVKMDEIADLPGASIVDALAGQVVGLNVSQSNGRPGSTGTFTVRSPAPKLTGAVEFGPLIVIDDVVQVDALGNPDMTTFNMLDHSEIESMTVLKDASAAVYGSRASNGVILVKTKRGQVGAPKITYSGKLDFADAVSHMKTMSAYETGVFTNRMFRQVKANGGTDYTNYSYSDAELEAMKGLNYNWLDKAWDSSLSHRHSLTVSGGADKVTFFAGLTYQKQETNLGSVQDYDKWTFRAGGEMKVASGLKLSASIAGYNNEKVSAKEQAKFTSGPWGNQPASQDYAILRHMPKYIPISVDVEQENGTMKNFYTSPWLGPHSVNTSNNNNVSTNYPIWNFFANEASKARKEEEENGYNANFSLIYDVPFVKGLSMKATYALSYTNSLLHDVGDYYTLARATNTNTDGNHLINPNTTYDYISYGRSSNIDNQPRVNYKKPTRKSEQMNFMITYDGSFGEHDISATAVVERGEASGNGLELLYKGPWDSYNGVSSSAGIISTGGTDNQFTRSESGTLSYIGRVNYKYSNRYLAQFLIRSDASTKFAPENYWGTFPTGSLGWVASEEKFFKNSKISKYVDYFKIRASLGKTGKDNVAAWSWMPAFDVSTTSGLGFGSLDGQPTFGAVFKNNGVFNRNIKWDTTIKQNYGIDVNLLDNRLSLSVDYFYDKTKDLLMQVTADAENDPVYRGAGVPMINYGKSDAWGWEFSVKWTDKINQSLLPSWGAIRYGIGMDYSISWNKLVLGEEWVFDYPAEMDEAMRTGHKGPDHEWGFRTWKHTSKGDGMLRTQDDIDKYWQYLTDLATAAGTNPNYLGVTSKDNMRLGMLAYEDVHGDIDVANQTIAGPNGVISADHGEDYIKLANDRRHNINTKLSAQWGNLSFGAQISTSWGGYSAINDASTYQSIGTGNDNMIWAQYAYVTDMFDPEDNPNGKYPSMAVSNAWNRRSDFWKVSTFRMYVRNMTLAYALPKELTQKINIDKMQFTLTGNNLWDFYNPYPKKFRNMYDSSKSGYPTLRTWTLGVNLTF
ncbi:SusC/RagA family TonB-linked outer membrane protein [Bacteroides sp. 51]|uniref:SusC/RagA family TonB-linked outer membrane protein n=1 Tax=Bacteroides sp. 51 TaxID=2302938 RepID=UPI0013D1CD8D|nr:SusC/RagA family TonB-linked outer membrane protein [Bacteroides sp. 51]NDV83297.1 SusC/RagA family TonB-linked outer membrane protein [Bacteroides sp. 51]